MADFTAILNWAINGTTPKNVLCFNNGTEDAGFATEFVDALRTFLISEVMSELIDELVLGSVTVRFDNSLPIWSFEVPVDGVVGGVDAQMCPGQNAILISTAYAGERPNRGRIYLPGLSEATCTEGLVATATQSALQAAFSGLVGSGLPLPGDACFLRIARRDEDGVITQSNPAEACVCRGNVATVRGRRFGSS